jgi:hypothetical protein
MDANKFVNNDFYSCGVNFQPLNEGMLSIQVLAIFSVFATISPIDGMVSKQSVVSGISSLEKE